MAKISSDDDEDYMSDKYLAECTDVRPGLVFQKSTKRKYEQEHVHKITNQRSRMKPRKVIEEEQREEGLQKALGMENKGFALLQKMGYKPGTSLGKSGTGRIEPIPVSVKVDRGGLGRDELLKQKRKEIASMKVRLQQKRQTNLTAQSQEFVNYQKTKLLERQYNKDLYNSQKSCQQLDQALGLDEPPEIWFWPEKIKKQMLKMMRRAVLLMRKMMMMMSSLIQWRS